LSRFWLPAKFISISSVQWSEKRKARLAPGQFDEGLDNLIVSPHRAGCKGADLRIPREDQESEHEREQERQEKEKEERLTKAIALLERHPEYSSVQVQIHERLTALQEREPLEAIARDSEVRLERVLKAFDIRADAYLRLVADLEHQKSFRVMLDYFVEEAWFYYGGFPLRIIPPPQPGFPVGELQAKVQRVWKRAQHWFIEGYRRIDSRGTFLSDRVPVTRRGYRQEIQQWMKAQQIPTVAQAAKRLGISKSALKSIMSDKGSVRYGDDRLNLVLSEIGYKEGE